jgi:nucleoid-associated protein YgaU
MKHLLIIALFVGSIATAFAQDPPPPASKPDEELKCKEADARIKLFSDQNATLKAKLDAVNADIAKAESDLAAAITSLKKCNDDIYALVGATEADVNAFRQRLGQIEGRVRELQRLTQEQLGQRQADVRSVDRDLNVLAQEQVAVLPEFFDRIVSLHGDIQRLYVKNPEKNYVVGTWAENRDCLWNIAGRAEIYADPMLWPRIWQANIEQIKNPDVIQPGWTLKVPANAPLNDDEKRAERVYWRKKRQAAAAAAAEQAPAAPTTAPAGKKSEAGN